MPSSPYIHSGHDSLWTLTFDPDLSYRTIARLALMNKLNSICLGIGLSLSTNVCDLHNGIAFAGHLCAWDSIPNYCVKMTISCQYKGEGCLVVKAFFP